MKSPRAPAGARKRDCARRGSGDADAPVRACADDGDHAQKRRFRSGSARRVLCALFACAVFACAGCERKERVFAFDSTNPLAVNPEVEWALVSVPYAACYSDADYASAVTTHYRRGEVLMVQGMRTVTQGDKRERWYAFESGWLPQSALSIYANKLRADNAARQLLAQ